MPGTCAVDSWGNAHRNQAALLVRKKPLWVQISTNGTGPIPKQWQLFAGVMSCWEPCQEEHPQLPEEQEIQSLTCKVQCFKAEPAPKMLRSRKSFSLFSPNTLVWVSQDSAWLLWHDQRLTGRGGDLCSALCTSQLPASCLFGGGAKLNGKTLTEGLHGDAAMAFQLAGKGCLKSLSNACGHLSEKKSGRVVLRVLSGWQRRTREKGRAQNLAFYISWYEVKDEQGECEILLKISCQPHRNNLTL